MNAIIKKLQYKLQEHVLIVSSPPAFREVLAEWKKITKVHTTPVKGASYSFVMIFVKTEADVKAAAKKYISLLEPDPVFWMAYPKKASKNYKAGIHRDSGWAPLGEEEYEGVAMVSIDDDWSALRFRKLDFIKTMKRREGLALSKEGKMKVKDRQ